MRPIHLSRNGENIGTYTLPQIQDMLQGGEVNYDTLAWQEGRPEWRPLKELIGPPPPRATMANEVNAFWDYISPAGRIGRLAYCGRNIIHFAVLVGLCAMLNIDESNGTAIILLLIFSGILWLTIAATSKRLHDIGRSGWFTPVCLLIPIIGLLLAFFPGEPGDNEFGADPKAKKEL